MINIPNLDPLYDEVCTYVKEHQGEKGYIDCQPYQKEAGDFIYCFVYNEESACNEERIVYGVRWNEKEEDLEICFEMSMRTYVLTYDEKTFKGENESANAEWYSVRCSDVYYVPTLFNIAEFIEEYGE